MNINLADVTLHIDEELSSEARDALEDALRQRDGVVSVHFNTTAKHPHLAVVEFNPEKVNSLDLLSIVRYQGYHGELVGL
jgi:divalent metal cation (Fe/Co/Zn/Cd) transporter